MSLPLHFSEIFVILEGSIFLKLCKYYEILPVPEIQMSDSIHEEFLPIFSLRSQGRKELAGLAQYWIFGIGSLY